MAAQEALMKTAIIVAVIAVICLGFAVNASAMPEYRYHIFYYDDNGNLVGEEVGYCSGFSSWGTVTERYIMGGVMRCGDFQPVTCEDLGLTGDGACGCVSDGYSEGYQDCMYANCTGQYAPGCQIRAHIRKRLEMQKLALFAQRAVTLLHN